MNHLLDNNPFMEECRQAYRKSPAFKAISEGKPLRNTVAAAIPREPGEDRPEPALGIPLDDLEREFADRLEP